MHILRAPENDYGHKPDDKKPDDAGDRAAAEAADREAAARAAKEKLDSEPPKPSDAEAKLLKELMKHKDTAIKAKADAEAANARLAAFEGMDPAKVKELVDAAKKSEEEKAAAELAAAEKRGEYDRVIASVKESAEVRVKAEVETKKALEDQLAASNKRIDDLVVGSAFKGSKFLADNTVLSGDKARRLYGDHFEIEDGEVVAYDKPKGAKERTPLVDGTGAKLAFEAALEKILRGDSDFESIAKSKLKPGSGSGPSKSNLGDNQDSKKSLTGRAAIAANLASREKHKPR